MNKGYRRRLNVCQCCIVVRRTRQIFSLKRLGSHTGVEWSLLIGWIGWTRDKKKRGLPEPSNVSLAAGIYMSAICCLHPILSCLVLSYLGWSCVLLSFVSTLLSLHSWHPFEYVVGCGNLVTNLPLHSYCLGFGTALSWLLVSCRFLVAWGFERILCRRLKLS